MPQTPHLPRQVADAHVDAYVALDPATGTYLGVRESSAYLPDNSPAWQADVAALARRTLRELDAAEQLPGAAAEQERRCARLLRERLTAQLAVYEADEHLRVVSNLQSPAHTVREVFDITPAETDQDWEALLIRVRAVPASFGGYRESLAAGLSRGLPGGPRAAAVFADQLNTWSGRSTGRGWLDEFVTAGPEGMQGELRAAARTASASLASLEDWMRSDYLPAVHGAPDTTGADRYRIWARHYNGSDTDLEEAYAYGWSEFHKLLGEMRAEARKVLPTDDPWEALAHLDRHGRHIEGVEETRRWLQRLMDEAIEALDGTHFELADRVREVESCLAPEGSAAAPYYTAPSHDFSRPGRTWLPTLGQTRFPVYDLVSTWYHEGVPGHHLQLAQWTHVSEDLSRYQTGLGIVSANAEGWALYAERLMDELGFLTDAEQRLGYLDAQMARALRVIVDIGMHMRLKVPGDSPFAAGETWTPELAEEFVGRHSGRPADYVASELTRYLSMPGQAIGYKLGERVWLRGREAARSRHGSAFDAKSWHMAALSQGSLGLDDLEAELARL